jgi:hypothetical protein
VASWRGKLLIVDLCAVDCASAGGDWRRVAPSDLETKLGRTRAWLSRPGTGCNLWEHFSLVHTRSYIQLTLYPKGPPCQGLSISEVALTGSSERFKTLNLPRPYPCTYGSMLACCHHHRRLMEIAIHDAVRTQMGGDAEVLFTWLRVAVVVAMDSTAPRLERHDDG